MRIISNSCRCFAGGNNDPLESTEFPGTLFLFKKESEFDINITLQTKVLR